MERPLDDDDRASRTRPPRQLDRRLDRLGAGVGEKHLAAERALRQPRAQAEPWLGVVQVGGVGEAPHLLANRLHDSRVTVADVQHRDPREEVEVLVAFVVPEAATGAENELDGPANGCPDPELTLP